jgi:hypothetical protein
VSDTSLVFNLVARDETGQTLQGVREKFDAAAAGIGVGAGMALGAGIAQSLDTEAANAKLAAQLGLGASEAADVAAVSASVYGQAWGDSVDTVNLAIKGVYQNIGDTSTAEGGLEGVTTKALALAETFDQDLTMATAAVGQMIRTGLADDADEAFDILAVGLGTAGDKAGDLLETFNEYSTQFRRVGLDGQTATGLLVQGLKNGAKDADQVADALGQFGEIALAGGSSVDDAFKSIGLNSATMAKMIGKGGSSAEKALQMTTDALRGTKDEQVKLNAAGALFGDPGKIMGDALFALDPAGAAAAAGMGKASGAMDKLVDKAGGSSKSALDKLKRQAMQKLADVAGTFIQFATENKAVVEPLTYTLLGLAAAVLTVKAGMAVYAAGAAVVAAAQWLMETSAMKTTAAWVRMNAVGLAAMARTAAASVVSAATTAAAWTGSALVSIGTWIAAVVRAAVVSAAQFVVMAAKAVAWAAVMAAQWLIAMGPVGWVIAAVIALVAVIIANWDTIKKWTVKAWEATWGFIKGVAGRLWNLFLNWSLPGLIIKHWQTIKTGVITKAGELLAWVRGLPGKISRAVGSLRSLLYSKGADVIRGLWNGIKGMGSWLAGQLRGFVSSYVPGPIADALGISSPSKLMADVVGRWIPPGIAEGAEDNRGILDKTMRGLVDPEQAIPGKPLGMGLAPLAGAAAGSGGRLTLLVKLDGPESVKRLIREIVAIDGGGDVQKTFGD